MILFLDFDGVLHPTLRGEPDFCRIHLLWEILRTCQDVDVVFTTSWREIYEFGELVQFVTRNGGEDMAPRFIGATPSFTRDADTCYLWHRNYECLLWLEGNGQAQRPWLALDDIRTSFPPESPKLYLTSNKTGLTETDVPKIIERLES